MKKILLIALVILVSACASETKYRNTMDSLVGRSENDVVFKLGKPDISYKEGSTTYIYYQKTNEANAYTIPFMGLKCMTKITVNDRNVVSGYDYNGVCIEREKNAY